MDGVSFLALYKVLGVFVLAIVLLRLHLPVGPAMGIGAAVLGLLFSKGPVEILVMFVRTLIEPKTLMIAAIVTLILYFSGSMAKLGQMSTLLGYFRHRIGGNRLGLVSFPSLIGLLPMPGGAVFSAPMLEAFDRDNQVTPAHKSFINYWFRHVWEFWWPLYPGVIMACAISELNLWLFVLVAAPLSVFAISAGLLQLRTIPRTLSVEAGEAPDKKRAYRALFAFVLAIVPGIAIGMVIQLMPESSPLASIPKELGLIIGLAAATLWVWWDGGIDMTGIRSVLLDERVFRMWVTIAGVYVFKGAMEQSGAAVEIGELLIHLDVPLVWVALLLPMLVGLITGLNFAFVAVSFPVLVTLIGAMGAQDHLLSLALLAFASGSFGTFVSPLHLCLILSNEYFGVSLGGMFRHLWAPASLFMLAASAYYVVLQAVIH